MWLSEVYLYCICLHARPAHRNVARSLIAIILFEIKMQYTLLLLSVTNLQLDGDWIRTVITE